MKFAAAFAVLAVLSAKTFVSAFSTADDFDLEMRDELSVSSSRVEHPLRIGYADYAPLATQDGELYDILARELLDYSDELDEVNARDLVSVQIFYLLFIVTDCLPVRVSTMTKTSCISECQCTVPA
jgi:hypothetical protein